MTPTSAVGLKVLPHDEHSASLVGVPVSRKAEKSNRS